MNTIINRLSFLLIIITTYLLSAQNFDGFVSEGVMYEIVDQENKIAHVAGVTPKLPKTVYIPETLEFNNSNYKITAIMERAFSTSILEGITISNSVTKIGKRAFENCVKLRKVTLPDNLDKIERLVFGNCNNLISIKLPNTIKAIELDAFKGCENIRKIEIPSSVKSIGNSAFENCTRLETLILNEGLERIEEFAFYHCEALNSLYFPKTLNFLGGNSFAYCYSLPNVEIPFAVTTIAENTFFGCKSLYSVTIPPSVTDIGPTAFSDCISLLGVQIPYSTNELQIGVATFAGCVNLTSVTLPENIYSIDDLAFQNCSSLKYLICKNKKSPFTTGNQIFTGVNPDFHVYVPKDADKSSYVTNNWPNSNDIRLYNPNLVKHTIKSSNGVATLTIIRNNKAFKCSGYGQDYSFPPKGVISNLTGSFYFFWVLSDDKLEMTDISVDNRRKHEFEVDDPVIKTYGDSIFNPVKITVGNGAISFDVEDNKVARGVAGNIQILGVGTTKVDFSITATAEFTSTKGSFTLIVKKRSLQINLIDKITKEYDKTNIATVTDSNFEIIGALKKDEIVILKDSLVATYDTPQVGDAKEVTVTNFRLPAIWNNRYELDEKSVKANIGEITKIDLNITLIGAVKKTYDGDSTATVTNDNFIFETKFDDIIEIDFSTAIANYDSPDVGEGKTVSVSNIILPSNLPDYYNNNVGIVTADIGIITPRPNIFQKWDDTLVFDNFYNEYSSWQWYENDVEIPGATKNYYYKVGGLSGTYYAKGTKKDGIEVLKSNVLDIPKSSDSELKKLFSISPNPIQAGETLKLVTPNNLSVTKENLSIWDLLGNKIEFEESGNEVQLSRELGPGMYILRFKVDNNTILGTNLLIR